MRARILDIAISVITKKSGGNAKYINQRAHIVAERSNESCYEDDLFDIDMDKGILTAYDWEETSNHAYDLGKLKTLEDIKRKIINNIK